MEHSDPPIMAWNAILEIFEVWVWSVKERSAEVRPTLDRFKRGSQANSTNFDLGTQFHCKQKAASLLLLTSSFPNNNEWKGEPLTLNSHLSCRLTRSSLLLGPIGARTFPTWIKRSRTKKGIQQSTLRLSLLLSLLLIPNWLKEWLENRQRSMRLYKGGERSKWVWRMVGVRNHWITWGISSMKVNWRGWGELELSDYVRSLFILTARTKSKKEKGF